MRTKITTALERFVVGRPVPGLVGRWCGSAHAAQPPRWTHEMNPSQHLCKGAPGGLHDGLDPDIRRRLLPLRRELPRESSIGYGRGISRMNCRDPTRPRKRPDALIAEAPTARALSDRCPGISRVR